MRRLALILGVVSPLLVAQPKKVVVMGLSEEKLAELRRVSPDLKIVNGSAGRVSQVTRITADTPENPADLAALLKEMEEADAFVGNPSRDVIVAGKKLKWVQVAQAGVELYLYPEVVNSEIVVTNYRGVAAPGIADHALGMLLALTRKLTYFIETRKEETWRRVPYNLLELEGKTAVIIGVGNIGSNVARRASACGMRVIGVDPKDLPPSPFVQKWVYPDRLDAVLPEADVVFVCAPATKESHNMIGARQFALMKPNSFFIVVSRGWLYDTNALVQALDSKKLAGAAIDVVEPEPLPPGHPLWKFPNIIITPHVATQGDGEFPRQFELLKDNLARFAHGERLRNIVDKQKGY